MSMFWPCTNGPAELRRLCHACTLEKPANCGAINGWNRGSDERKRRDGSHGAREGL